MIDHETPVFDRRETPCVLPKIELDWQPLRRFTVRGASVTVACQGDPDPMPHEDDYEAVDRFIQRGSAWYSSEHYSGQAANDNKDWPLEKLLLTEKNEACLRLARRYRDLQDSATRPTQLIGQEADNLYVVINQDKAGKSKGVKVVTGRKANTETAPTRSKALTDQTKKRAAAVPKKWNGDWPILSAIDAKRELAFLRAKLAYVPKILDAFEWAVCDNLTLAEIGERLGAGSKGGKGEARARIFDGFGIVDRYWRKGCCTPAEPAVTVCVPWQDGAPVPAGYYRSKLQPNMIFPQAAS